MRSEEVFESELEIAKNEVLLKIGRNVLGFQFVEKALKCLIMNGKIDGTISELHAKQRQLSEAIQKQTMGKLVGKYLSNISSPLPENMEAPEGLNEMHFAFLFSVGDASYHQSKTQTLASIVEERNELIHHFLERFDLITIESCLAANLFLEQQHIKLRQEANELSSKLNLLIKAKKMLAEYIGSGQFMKDYEYFTSGQSRITVLLAEIAAQFARTDGWTLLSTAGQKLWQQAPEEMANLKKCKKFGNLKQFILETQVYDVTEEPSDKSGTRPLYRLKSDWEWQAEPGEITRRNQSR